MRLDHDQAIQLWRPVIRAFDPVRELGVEEIEQLYAERAEAPYRSLATDLALAEPPSALKVILCGARGSGKSTELTRLARAVRDDLCVVHTNLAAALPDEANTVAILTLLGVAGLHAIQIWSGSDDADLAQRHGARQLDAALAKFGDAALSVATLLDGVAGVVTVFNPAAGAALASASLATKATGAATSLGAKLRHAFDRGPLQRGLPDDKRDDAKSVLDAVNEILDELAELAGRPPLLLADGLDKRAKVEDVKLALSEEHLLRELRASLVLTGPVNLRHDPRFRSAPGNFDLRLLYNVPVCQRAEDGSTGPSTPGIDMLVDLYERRRVGEDLSDALVPATVVTRAAYMSSGIVRDFLALIHASCKRALEHGRPRTEPGDLDAAIKQRRLELEGYLNEDRLKILARVLVKGVLPANPEADILLFENFIACYPNSDIWFRPHELIAEFVARYRDDGD